MGLEFLERFLAMPQITDIVSYALIVIIFIVQLFIKRFVRKDNLQTLFRVDARTAMVDKLQAELTAERKRLEGEFSDEHKRLEDELTAERKRLQDDWAAERQKLQDERETFASEKAGLLDEITVTQNEIAAIRQAIRIGLMNDPHLVSNGFAKEIAKTLGDTKMEDIENG